MSVLMAAEDVLSDVSDGGLSDAADEVRSLPPRSGDPQLESPAP